MIKSKKLQLVMVLVLACLCAPVLSAEPNEAGIELKFDMRNVRPPARHLMPRSSSPDVDTHYAVLFVRGDWDIYMRSVPIEAIIESSAGQSMSQIQRDVISNQSIRFMDSGMTISNYTYFQLFGVSEDDVQKMVNAFIEVLANNANQNVKNYLNRAQERKKEIGLLEKESLSRETELKGVQKSLEDVKKKVHYLSVEETRKAIEDLNKKLDELNIEIAGMERKLFAIREEHENAKKDAQGIEQQKIYKSTIWPRLEQMRIDQIIELKVAEEKKRIAMKIRAQAEEFHNLNEQSLKISKFLGPLRQKLLNYQTSLHDTEERIKNPGPEMLPPKVFQNKVTIYPVRVEED